MPIGGLRLGWKGKYLAQGHNIQTSSQLFCRGALPFSQLTRGTLGNCVAFLYVRQLHVQNNERKRELLRTRSFNSHLRIHFVWLCGVNWFELLDSAKSENEGNICRLDYQSLFGKRSPRSSLPPHFRHRRPRFYHKLCQRLVTVDYYRVCIVV